MDPEVEIEDLNVEAMFVQCHDIVRRINSFIPYQDFFSEHLLGNQPCIFSEFISSNWQSRKAWTSMMKPNWQFLKETYGNVKVPVADCSKREYNSQKKETSTVKEYLDYLETYTNEGYPQSKPILYLKDWHFIRDFPTSAVYQLPKYFASDWLNEYFSARKDLCDDYRFVYIGPKGSWTPLHADVFTSYSWSVNVVGRKRWLLFPPGEEVYLRDELGNLAFDVTCECSFDGTNFCHKNQKGKYFEIFQESGEAIFVPSGWHHQVWNLEDTISINHNWINGCNIKQMWLALQSSLTAVQREISDCLDMEDWDSHCQLMLRASHGMNYEEFFDLLECIAESRIIQIRDSQDVIMFGGWKLGNRHAAWDLKQILMTLNHMHKDPTFPHILFEEKKNLPCLIEKIENVLCNFF